MKKKKKAKRKVRKVTCTACGKVMNYSERLYLHRCGRSRRPYPVDVPPPAPLLGYSRSTTELYGR